MARPGKELPVPPLRVAPAVLKDRIRAPAGQPVHGDRRRPPLHRVPGDAGPGGARILEAAEWAACSDTPGDLADDPGRIEDCLAPAGPAPDPQPASSATEKPLNA